MAARKSNRKTQNILAEARAKFNKAGRYYNVRFVNGLPSTPSLEAIEEALNILVKPKQPIRLRARNEWVVQRSGENVGAIWVDVYPQTENPFAASAEGGAA